MAQKQTVLVTGATSGIGLLIANTLHNNGYIVFGTSRYPEKHKDKVPFELLPLDVTLEASIQNCIDILLTKTPVLDVLVNNAGGFLGGSVEETTMEQAYRQFETNFWGAVKMTKAVLPVMRKQRSGKIITTGSLIGLIGVPLSSYYAATKHALEGFFKSLRFEVKNFNIKISVIEPSFYKTNIDAAGELATESIADYDKIRKLVNDFVEESISSSPTPEPVAELVLKIVQTKEPKFSYPIGKNSKLLPALQFLSPSTFESGFLKKLKL
jgi:NAD(P)-dependent dehydrogenase (short-subunit alcohol dehydrogenase family)